MGVTLKQLSDAVSQGVQAGIAAGNGGRGGAAALPPAGAVNESFASKLGGNIFNADLISRAISEMTRAAQQLAQTRNTAFNSDIPAVMRNQLSLESLPFGVGSAFNASRNIGNSLAMESFGPGMNGLTSQSELMRRNDRDFGINSQTSAARFATIQQASTMMFQSHAARARSMAMNAVSSPTIASFDQSTVGGMFAQQEEMMRAPHRFALSLAEGEAGAARGAHTLASAQLQAAERTAAGDRAAAERAARALDQLSNFQADPATRRRPVLGGSQRTGADQLLDLFSTPGSSVGPTEQQLRQAQNHAALTAQQAERSSRAVGGFAAREQQTGVAAINAEAAARQQLVETLRTETQIMQMRAQRLEGVAANFGNMQPVDRRIALNSIVRAQRHGWDSLTPFERSSVAGADPTLANRLATQAGENSFELQAMRGMPGTTVGETPGTIAENRQAAIERAREAQAAELQNRQETAARAASVIEEGNKKMIEALEHGYVEFVGKVTAMFARVASGLRG